MMPRGTEMASLGKKFPRSNSLAQLPSRERGRDARMKSHTMAWGEYRKPKSSQEGQRSKGSYFIHTITMPSRGPEPSSSDALARRRGSHGTDKPVTGQWLHQSGAGSCSLYLPSHPVGCMAAFSSIPLSSTSVHNPE